MRQVWAAPGPGAVKAEWRPFVEAGHLPFGNLGSDGPRTAACAAAPVSEAGSI